MIRANRYHFISSHEEEDLSHEERFPITASLGVSLFARTAYPSITRRVTCRRVSSRVVFKRKLVLRALLSAPIGQRTRCLRVSRRRFSNSY